MEDLSDIEEAAKIASYVRIKTICFTSIIAQSFSPQKGTDVQYGLEEVPVLWTSQDKGMLAIVQLRLALQSDGNVFGEFNLDSRIDYELETDSLPSDSAISKFVELNCVLHAWPYLRAEAQSLSLKLGMPMMLLPVLRAGQAAALTRPRRMA